MNKSISYRESELKVMRVVYKILKFTLYNKRYRLLYNILLILSLSLTFVSLIIKL